MAGAPLGNQNAVKAKRWQQAIDRALERRSKAAGIEELDRLAEKYLDTVEVMADKPAHARGSVSGFETLGDRLDGKPPQALEHSGPDGQPLPNSINVNIVKPNA